MTKRAADLLAYVDRPGTSNGPTEAINGRFDHLRGSALDLRNLANSSRSEVVHGPQRTRTVPRMGDTVQARPLSKNDSVEDTQDPRGLLVLSGVALTVQVAATDYGPGQGAAAGLWFVLGCLLLGLVYRKHSRTARGVVIVTSLMGAVAYGVGALEDAHSAFLAFTFFAQAAPLLTRRVRLHVQTAV